MFGWVVLWHFPFVAVSLIKTNKQTNKQTNLEINTSVLKQTTYEEYLSED